MSIRFPDWLKKPTQKIGSAISGIGENIEKQVGGQTGFWGTPVAEQEPVKSFKEVTTPIIDRLTTRQPLPEQIRERIPEKLRPAADIGQKIAETPRILFSSFLFGTPESRKAKEQEGTRMAELERKFAEDVGSFKRSDEFDEYINLVTKRGLALAKMTGGIKDVSGWRQVGAVMPEDTARNVLKVKKGATEKQINEAYKKFATKYHPDKGGDPKAFELAKRAKDSLLSKLKPEAPVGPLALGSGGEQLKGVTAPPPAPPAGNATEEGLRQRAFLETIQKGEKLSPEFAEGVKNLEQTYVPHTNQSAISWAEKKISTDGLDKSLDWARNLKATELEKSSDKAGALFERAIKKSVEAGDNDRAIALADEADSLFRGGGRLVQAASMWNNMSPNAMVRFAEKTFDNANKRGGIFGKKVEMTKELEKQIIEKMKEAIALPTEAEKTAAILEIKELIAREIPPSLVDWVDAYRYNNMLSSPRTQMREFWGDLTQAFINKPATLASRASIDLVESGLTGKEREYYLKEVPEYYKGINRGWTSAIEGFKSALAGNVKMGRVAMETGVAEETDVMRAVQAEKAPKALTIFPRLMDATERFFAALISSGEYAVQISKGASEKEALVKADKVAEYFLYKSKKDPTNKTGQGLALSAIDGATKLMGDARKIPTVGPVIGWHIPFIQTSMNIVKQQLEYSPAGLLTAIGSDDKRGQLAKALIGSLVSLIGVGLATENRTTWSVPRDEKGKELFYAAGKKPYSIKVGSVWVPMPFFGPYTFALAIPAAVNHYYQESKTAMTDTQAKKFIKSLQGVVGFYGEETFLSGLNSLTRVLSGEQSIEEGAAFTMGQFIPLNAMLGYVAKVIDPVFRQAKGFKESVLRDLPFTSKQLEPYLDPEGKESVRNLSDFLAPYTIGIEDPEYAEQLETHQERQRITEPRAWYKREVNKIKAEMVDISRNQDMSEEEKDKRIEARQKELEELTKRFIEISGSGGPLQTPATAPARQSAPPAIKLGPARGIGL